MRRLRKSTISAFTLGLFWASASSAAAVAVYYYLAPPGSHDGTADAVQVSQEDAVDRWSRPARRVADATVASVSEVSNETAKSDAELRRAQTRVAQQQADVEAQRVLTRSIQQELARVGCYKGTIDGRWSDSTRSAMEAFTSAVEVRLPLAAPDYILLTMLQGQNGQTCDVRKEPAVTIARTEAPVPVPRPARKPERSEQQAGWTTSVASLPPRGRPPSRNIAPPPCRHLSRLSASRHPSQQRPCCRKSRPLHRCPSCPAAWPSAHRPRRRCSSRSLRSTLLSRHNPACRVVRQPPNQWRVRVVMHRRRSARHRAAVAPASSTA